MKKLTVLIVTLAMLFTLTVACAETKTITLGNDTIANTTPFGNCPVNQQYQLFKGMVLTVVGEYDGWLVVKYGDDFGSLFIETGSHNMSGATVQIPTATGITRGVVGEGWQVWARSGP